MDTLEYREILLQKHCTALQNPVKKQRRIALENIRKEIIENDAETDEKVIAQLFKTVQKDIIRSIRDDSEACREFAVNFLKEIILKLPKDDNVLGFIIPEVRERLAGVEIKESSEEVRLSIILLLRSIVVKYGSLLAPYFNDFVDILKKTIVDPYPTVKKESCECAADLSKAIPRHFHLQSESLIKPFLQAMTHQHYRIRVAVIKSLGDVVCNGNNKSVNDVTTALAERLFDQNATVRKTVAEVVGKWLVKLPDRYSYWYKLIPLMLTCLSDEIESQAEDAWLLWETAGLQWVSENETDLKDKLDFLPKDISFYPNGVRRPNIGCRELVQREMSKYLPAVGVELTDWKVDIRVRTAQLLCVTIQHAEQNITQSLAKILPPMYKAFCDEDKRVVENIIISAELLGYFVPVEVYSAQILPAIEDGANVGNLGVLACIVKYSPKEDISAKMKDILDVVDNDNICYSTKVKEQEQLLNLVSSLLNNSEKESICNVTQQLFNVIVCVLSITENDVLIETAKGLLNKLQDSNDDTQREDLSKTCARSLLERIKPSLPHWTLHSPELHIFYYILKELEYGVAVNLDIIIEMLKDLMDESMDPEVVLKILWLIFDLLQNDKLIAILDDKDYFFKSLLTDVLPKQLVWRAGRSPEALRTASTACLNQGLFNMTKMTSVKITSDLFNLFLPHLLSLAEESVIKTRIYSLESLRTLIRGAKIENTLTVDNVNTLIPVVMKRLDDVSDKVRLTALSVIGTVYHEPTVVCGEHIVGALQNVLLIHLDDPNPETRNIVLDTLKDVGKDDPKSLLGKISLELFRDRETCTKLMDYLKDETANK